MGFRKGRTHPDPDDVQAGDQIDYFRVEVAEPGRRLRLRAQMKMPGDAWLQFEALPIDTERSRLVQSVFFASKGLFGLAYWVFLYPIHRLVFSRMFQRLVCAAETAPRPI